MDLRQVVLVSLRSLRANRLRSSLTMLGVVIGVAAVILLVSLGEGAKRYIQNQLSGLGSNVLIITPGKVETQGGMPFPLGTTRKLTFEDGLAIFRQCPSLADVSSVVVNAATVEYGKRSRNVTVLGVTNNFQEIRNIRVEVGSFIPDNRGELRQRVVAIGRRIERELFEGKNPLGELIKIGGTKYRVIGVMEPKGMAMGFDLDDLVYIPVRSAQDLFDTDQVFEILAQARDEFAIDDAVDEITQVLVERHDRKEDFTITSQNAMLSSLLDILGTFTYVLAGIASISLLVGGIGIMNIMLVSVTERTREIGLRKALGARRRDILRQFLVESVVLSLLGGMAGVTVGNAGALLMGILIPALPIRISWWSVALGFVFSTLVGVFFGVYPARRAALLDPVEALRYE